MIRSGFYNAKTTTTYVYPEVKKQMVGLYENGKSRAAIVEEYDLTASALDHWIKQAQT
ncbi:helix-turn-helix domain-containing protein, partial [Brevibacillus parabrevis]|nr:helix-turn-helix domain-containing protein [Brevibacillus parabrevis]